MPLIRCENGWKWGESGKCYPTREEALRQARAILASQSKDEKPPEIRDTGVLITKVKLNDSID